MSRVLRALVLVAVLAAGCGKYGPPVRARPLPPVQGVPGTPASSAPQAPEAPQVREAPAPEVESVREEQEKKQGEGEPAAP